GPALPAATSPPLGPALPAATSPPLGPALPAATSPALGPALPAATHRRCWSAPAAAQSAHHRGACNRSTGHLPVRILRRCVIGSASDRRTTVLRPGLRRPEITFRNN